MSERYFDRQGREIKASSATEAGWAIVDRDGLEPMRPRPGPYDHPPRVKLTTKTDAYPGMTGHWEWVLTRCQCGRPVLWPTNVGTDNACWFHRDGGDRIDVGLEELGEAIYGEGGGA